MVHLASSRRSDYAVILLTTRATISVSGVWPTKFLVADALLTGQHSGCYQFHARFEPKDADWRDTPDPLRKLIVSMMESDANERMTDFETIDHALDAMLIQLSK